MLIAPLNETAGHLWTAKWSVLQFQSLIDLMTHNTYRWTQNDTPGGAGTSSANYPNLLQLLMPPKPVCGPITELVKCGSK